MRCKTVFVLSLLGMLLFPVFLDAAKFKEIDVSKHKYISRKSKIWEKDGRLVGEINRAPETFTIEVRKVGAADQVFTETHHNWLSIYETAFIPQGRYNVTIKATGYLPHVIKNLEIKAGSDCVLDISFGTIVYDKG